MSYEAKIVKIDGTNLKVHFDNGHVERLSSKKEWQSYIKDYGKKQESSTKKKLKRSDE